MGFRQYRRASSGPDAAVQQLLYWLTIVTAPIWVPLVAVVALYQHCSSNTPAAKAERSRIEAQRRAAQEQEEQRQREAAWAAAHEPWDSLRCEALFARLDRAVRWARQGSDASAIEASNLRQQADDHNCQRPASQPKVKPSATPMARYNRKHSSVADHRTAGANEESVCERAFAGYPVLVESCISAYAKAPDARQMLVGQDLNAEQTACLESGGPQYPSLWQSCVDNYSRSPDARLMLARQDLKPEHRACFARGGPQYPSLWQSCVDSYRRLNLAGR